MTKLRSVKVTYSDGAVINTNMAAHITDEAIREYFAIGKPFNIGYYEYDNIQTVRECEIIQ